MLSFNETISAGENAEAMLNASLETVNGELTYAIRDTKFNGFDIKENDLLALVQGQITGCGQDMQGNAFGAAGQDGRGKRRC